MATTTDEKVRRYFDRSAARFDLIYREDKTPLQRLVDRLFRGVVNRRFELTLARCGDVSGLRVLDVGCGSGRYSVELARRGARVVGLDLALAMVQMATAAAADAGVSHRCRFEQADFMAWDDPEPFSIGLAIGFFDYIDQPERFATRLGAHIQGRVFCSFPVRWTLRTPIRWVRLNMNRCPVHFYSRDKVDSLFASPPWVWRQVDRLSRDYLLEARTSV